ncbi:MAG: DUF4430 domain-containing protein [Oscillospiraceae bacterium]|nr:DUF4430 domain-containing protein [Oscillospiraceae bacterium]
MKNKKLVIALIAFVAVAAILLGVYFATRPETSQGAKEITVTVVHKDGSEKVFTYHTDEEYLDKVLLTEGLISGSEGQYGLVIETVDGEAAIWETDGAYWSLYIGEEYATTGISSTPVHDGSTFKLVYEVFSES